MLTDILREEMFYLACFTARHTHEHHGNLQGATEVNYIPFFLSFLSCSILSFRWFLMRVSFHKLNPSFALKWKTLFLVKQGIRFSDCLFFTYAVAWGYSKLQQQWSLSLLWSHWPRINAAGLEIKATNPQGAPPWWKLPSLYTKESF